MCNNAHWVPLLTALDGYGCIPAHPRVNSAQQQTMARRPDANLHHPRTGLGPQEGRLYQLADGGSRSSRRRFTSAWIAWRTACTVGFVRFSRRVASEYVRRMST
jgi:hypothetical protein